jgi:steroid delta-isomerase-like uncharacterized protein
MKRRTFIAGAALATTLPIAAKADPVDEARALAERFASTLTAHDMDAFAALFGDDYTNHQVSAAAPAPPATISAKQGSVGFFKSRLTGMPDLRVTIEAVVASADQFAASFVYEGTHSGTYLGVPATGRKLRFTSCDIFRIKDGKLVEHWGMGDVAGQLAQLKG